MLNSPCFGLDLLLGADQVLHLLWTQRSWLEKTLSIFTMIRVFLQASCSNSGTVKAMHRGVGEHLGGLLAGVAAQGRLDPEELAGLDQVVDLLRRSRCPCSSG